MSATSKLLQTGFFFPVRIHGDKKKRCGRDSQWQRLYFSPPFSDMKPIALFSATYSGWSLAKSAMEGQEQWEKIRGREPWTWPQSVGMVASYSYMVIVNALKTRKLISGLKLRWMALTVNFILVFHEDERIKIDIAVEMDVWSGTSDTVSCRMQACKK